jgi:retron-type reverse transcriptase
MYLIQNYLSNRKQCVKSGTALSTCQDIYKGIPQGSILGPVLLNIFINDIFYFIPDSSLYNYADDNTLSYSGYDLDKIINTLEKDSHNLIDWFTLNQMKVNPDKFQAIAIGKNTQSKNISFNLNGNIKKTEDEVKLLE